MDVASKLAILADAAKYDASCASSGSKTTRAGSRIGSTEGMGICHSYTPDGRCVSLLKILLTNYCVYDCQYCINRLTSETPRARFTVDEVVKLTLDFYKRNYIEGLFLSSGIIQSSDYTMEQLVAVAQKLREEHRFGGYIHLKTIPGASDRLLTQAGLFADRLSVNVELPTIGDLKQLAPEKNQPEIIAAMDTIGEQIDENRADQQAGFKTPKFVPAGQSTQMIIGATDTPDREVLRTSSALYDQQKLRRVYYSAYSPIPHSDARLPAMRPPLEREHRLYQADWLLRFYGFGIDEIVTEADNNLSLEHDPKLAWALAHREQFPVDVNKAARKLLLRVPGLGVRSVDRMIAARKHHSLSQADLKLLGVAWKRAKAFVTTRDYRPPLHALDSLQLVDQFRPRDRQLLLFEAANSGRTGEV
jgi:putative DNA modification/repair radical SAM protein